jgi:hypothetical protein
LPASSLRICSPSKSRRRAHLTKTLEKKSETLENFSETLENFSETLENFSENLGEFFGSS